MNDDDWVGYDTLLGMLQRGRGRGLQRAISVPDAGPLVVRCIELDAQWDRQTEERGDYFARLLTALGIPLGDIAVDFSDPDLPASVWFETVLALTRCGSVTAVRTLHTYVRDAAQPADVDWLIVQIWDEAGAAARVGLMDVALERLDDEALHEAVDPREDGPWWAWRAEPSIAAALDLWSPIPTLPRPDLSAIDRAGLLAIASEPAYSRERSAAFSELARHGDLALLDLAERPELRNTYGAVPGLQRAVIDLGPATLRRARSWARTDDEFLAPLAGRILAAHGSSEDGRMLLEMFDADLDEGFWTSTEELAGGLGRIGVNAAVPSLVRAWEATLHSHARVSYLSALAALGSDNLGVLYAEAVDDCEREVRDLVPLMG